MILNADVLKVVKFLLEAINVFFVAYMIGYSTFIFLSVIVGASTLYRRRREMVFKNVTEDNYYIPISIIVPAYNEEVTVVDTVKSLLSLEYNIYEIIVVDDGSKDKTAQVLVDAFDMKQIRRPIRRLVKSQPMTAVYETMGQKVPITLVSKKNGGKADALNMGINAAKYPYFICMDADSMLQYDSLSEIVRPVLENDNVVAVGGSVRPSNSVELEYGRVKKYRLPNNILACMQALEYDRSFLASRILLDSFNGTLIISGAFGLFKRDMVIACGGYDANTMGEDMELVVKLHEYCVNNKQPYQIRYASNAICWSQVPENLHDLAKQRRRWHRGLYQSLEIHRKMLGNKLYAPVSTISYPYFMLYELYSPYIELLGLVSIVLALMAQTLNIKFAIVFFCIYAAFGAVMSLTAFFSRIHTIDLKIGFMDVVKAVLLCFFEISFLRFILAIVRMGALIGIKKNGYSWGSIERKKQNLKG